MAEQSNNAEARPRLLDLIPKGERWSSGDGGDDSSDEMRKLELRLGPPGGDWGTHEDGNGVFPSSGGVLSSSPWPQQQSGGPFLGFPTNPQSSPVLATESSRPCCTERPDSTVSPLKKNAGAAVVGWPPVRSFRKNNVSKQQAQESHYEKGDDVCRKGKGLFVKINMDGVPIGRKVDLMAYHSYEHLAGAVDELFRGLLSAQKSSFGAEEKAVSGLLDGNGDYVLVYEDNEGDRMLVGDVPWRMFECTAKRLRVLKRSETSGLRREVRD